MLIGIVVKNGIVLIDLHYSYVVSGACLLFIRSSFRAVARLRPVLMTTFYHYSGTVPMAIGGGERF